MVTHISPFEVQLGEADGFLGYGDASPKRSVILLVYYLTRVEEESRDSELRAIAIAVMGCVFLEQWGIIAGPSPGSRSFPTSLRNPCQFLSPHPMANGFLLRMYCTRSLATVYITVVSRL